MATTPDEGFFVQLVGEQNAESVAAFPDNSESEEDVPKPKCFPRIVETAGFSSLVVENGWWLVDAPVVEIEFFVISPVAGEKCKYSLLESAPISEFPQKQVGDLRAQAHDYVDSILPMPICVIVVVAPSTRDDFTKTCQKAPRESMIEDIKSKIEAITGTSALEDHLGDTFDFVYGLLDDTFFDVLQSVESEAAEKLKAMVEDPCEVRLFTYKFDEGEHDDEFLRKHCGRGTHMLVDGHTQVALLSWHQEDGVRPTDNVWASLSRQLVSS